MICYFTYEARQRIAKALPGNWGFTMSGFQFEGNPKSDDEVLEMLLRRNKVLHDDMEHLEFLYARVKDGIGPK